MPVRCAPTPHVCPRTHDYNVRADTGFWSFPASVQEDVLHAEAREYSSPSIPRPRLLAVSWRRAGDGTVHSSTGPLVRHRGTSSGGKQDGHGSETCFEALASHPAGVPGDGGGGPPGAACPHSLCCVVVPGGEALKSLRAFQCHTIKAVLDVKKPLIKDFKSTPPPF